jgi:hypothetical protein
MKKKIIHVVTAIMIGASAITLSGCSNTTTPETIQLTEPTGMVSIQQDVLHANQEVLAYLAENPRAEDLSMVDISRPTFITSFITVEGNWEKYTITLEDKDNDILVVWNDGMLTITENGITTSERVGEPAEKQAEEPALAEIEESAVEEVDAELDQAKVLTSDLKNVHIDLATYLVNDPIANDLSAVPVTSPTYDTSVVVVEGGWMDYTITITDTELGLSSTYDSETGRILEIKL